MWERADAEEETHCYSLLLHRRQRLQVVGMRRDQRAVDLRAQVDGVKMAMTKVCGSLSVRELHPSRESDLGTAEACVVAVAVASTALAEGLHGRSMQQMLSLDDHSLQSFRSEK